MLSLFQRPRARCSRVAVGGALLQHERVYFELAAARWGRRRQDHELSGARAPSEGRKGCSLDCKCCCWSKSDSNHGEHRSRPDEGQQAPAAKAGDEGDVESSTTAVLRGGTLSPVVHESLPILSLSTPPFVEGRTNRRQPCNSLPTLVNLTRHVHRYPPLYIEGDNHFAGWNLH